MSKTIRACQVSERDRLFQTIEKMVKRYGKSFTHRQRRLAARELAREIRESI